MRRRVSGSLADDEHRESRQAVLILRLSLDGQAQLRRGELLDAEAVPQARFVTLLGMTDAVKRWLEQQRQATDRDANR